MKIIAVILALLTIIAGWRITPLSIVVNGIEVPRIVILSALSIAILGLAVLFRKPS